MSFSNGQFSWQPTALSHSSSNRSFHLLDDVPARTATPSDNTLASMPEAPLDAEDEKRRAHFADLYRAAEEKVALLFGDDGSYNHDAIKALERWPPTPTVTLPPTTDHGPIREPPLKKARRAIDEDDYGDDDDEDDDDEDEDDDDGDKGASSAFRSQNHATSATAAAGSLLSPSKSGSSPVQSVKSPGQVADKFKTIDGSQAKGKPPDDAIQKLDEVRIAAEAAARKSFHTIIYTLENDRTAMLEQQQLEDSEKQLQAEMEHNSTSNVNGAQAANQGSLSSANLGASSLTLKHLIARIDMKRDQVRASDAELRLLMNEVRKNRSKWANEENVNQEELYEALEKVLTELKAHTEYSTPFLTRVNKRDAPDYYNFIKNPMDLGSMTKKLKSLTYKSKSEFVVDLNLIWDNCLKYNQDMNHPLRRMANGMRKEAEKLIPLIPDLTIRSRAEVEAEERKKQNGGEDDAGEDSDDEPIMSSRGRKATTKGATKSRKAPSDHKEDTPVVDQKPLLQINGLPSKLGREGSEAIDGSNGFGTPPIGSLTPGGAANGASGITSNVDAMEIDGPSINGMTLNQAFGQAAEQAYEDEEYNIWKQSTKKDRALAAKARFMLFPDNKLSVEAPALLRTKAGIRRFLAHQKEAEAYGGSGIHGSLSDNGPNMPKDSGSKAVETLADGIEEEKDQIIPDYYTPLSTIPDIPTKLQWVEDGDGQVINQHGDYLSLVPEGSFVAPKSKLSSKIDNNIRQIQETRKLATKISVIKQMQVQSQVYTNQFPKSNLEPFRELDIDPHFVSDDGPVMAPELCQDAFKRSIAKILYSTGFEELQPSALDAFTGIASDYFHKLVHTFNVYREAEKGTPLVAGGTKVAPRFTPEEVVLHTLDEGGHDVQSLEGYVVDDVERLHVRLGTLHDRMKTHLADLLRPALTGEDDAGAFNDGSEQFTSGDFAEDLGEDFFGFRALGLDKEMGLDSISVPFHLLQSRVRNQYQMQTQAAGVTSNDLVETLPVAESINRENIQSQIGLVKNFFLAKLHANGDQPLVEDEDLPTKQRKPRPRLGASGKIISAQKRPPKEQLALAKKKKKLEAAAAEAKLGGGGDKATTNGGGGGAKRKGGGGGGGGGGGQTTNGTAPNPAILALAPSMERTNSMQSQGGMSQTDKDDTTGMMSPESIAP